MVSALELTYITKVIVEYTEVEHGFLVHLILKTCNFAFVNVVSTVLLTKCADVTTSCVACFFAVAVV